MTDEWLYGVMIGATIAAMIIIVAVGSAVRDRARAVAARDAMIDLRSDLIAERAKSANRADAITRLIENVADAAPRAGEPFLPHRQQVFDRVRLVILDAFGKASA